MKLMRLGDKGAERPAVWASEEEAFDLSAVIKDYDPSFFADGGLERVRDALKRGGLPRVKLAETRIGAPVARPSKLMAVGLNYVDHAKETNAAIPEKPIFFDKASTAINGPYDDVVMPGNYATVDYEVELAFVIGKRCKRVKKADALAHVAGYLVCNDVSERTAQIKEGGQWYRGKSFDTFAPLGPWLVTTDELSDPHALELCCAVDGEVRQTGNTANFIFNIPFLIEFVSRNVTLEPGDVITTGTPPGVAMAMKPPRYLTVGQVVELEITGLGKQRSKIVTEPV
jgi:2-keto-4-pentenoate hydratase/2-oxohepta-3-ene-1,7-dioic acid hydratase in catechol pathway